MAYSRLRLDFNIDKATDRKAFLDKYIEEEFTKKGKTLTQDELEMMGNYILWGKDDQDKNAVQRKEVQIDTKFGAWDAKEPESLDALMEDPAFNENRLGSIYWTPPSRTKQKFSREDALRDAPDGLKETFKTLFRTIDRNELICNYYELLHGKREKPPRDQLLNKFTEEEREELQQVAAALKQYEYLKKRHLIVELRSEQYTLRDAYAPIIFMPQSAPDPQEMKEPPVFNGDIPVLPLGIFDPIYFQDEEFFAVAGEKLHEDRLKELSKILWKYKKLQEKLLTESGPQFSIDFRNTEHLFQIMDSLNDFQIAIDNEEENNKEIKALVDAFYYYIELADLDPIHAKILDMKIHGIKNADIAFDVNKEFGKTYTVNYISTIFRQKILPQIAEAAQYHQTLMENCFFPENFKRCNYCGKYYLKDPKNFVRKTCSKDGYTTRCKKCDHRLREQKKGGTN